MFYHQNFFSSSGIVQTCLNVDSYLSCPSLVIAKIAYNETQLVEHLFQVFVVMLRAFPVSHILILRVIDIYDEHSSSCCCHAVNLKNIK